MAIALKVLMCRFLGWRTRFSRRPTTPPSKSAPSPNPTTKNGKKIETQVPTVELGSPKLRI
ncbi:hypothetical protein GEK51_06695 [Lacticaseibacillus rhamnosus]|nr:hypothetical protein GEK51_06695 [Lacticaseibacillus rhamnosus]